ncbi:hypothetical protein NXC24_PC02091 (plasmid) [Rhizobium sp. NXC24]|nr:hypothetical protein NXC24_PC02091 [Rhizobium sp. NXC24]
MVIACGVKRHGIIACSCVQAHFDLMISGMVADAIKAFARHHFENSDDFQGGTPFEHEELQWRR